MGTSALMGFVLRFAGHYREDAEVSEVVEQSKGTPASSGVSSRTYSVYT